MMNLRSCRADVLDYELWPLKDPHSRGRAGRAQTYRTSFVAKYFTQWRFLVV